MARPRDKNSDRPPLGLEGLTADEIERVQTYLKRKDISFEQFKRALIRGFLKSGKIGDTI